MRVSREKLIDLAKVETEKRAEGGDVVAGYIIGSVAAGNPILGGTADVDLVLIHKKKPHSLREVIPFSDDFHLDITHHILDLYERPTDLRIDPWLGPSMCEPLFLYDPGHFFERAQAGVRGRFHRVDHVHARAQAFLSRARGFKLGLEREAGFIPNYLRSLIEGSNAVATLAGFPAAGRRMNLILETRLEQAEAGHFYDRFLMMHGADRVERDLVDQWMGQWDLVATEGLGSDDQTSITRHRYYLSGFEALLAMGRPEVILWKLIEQWDKAVHIGTSHSDHKEHRRSFINALTHLDLSQQDRARRAEELENYLDDIEEYLEQWADRYGA